VLEALAARLAFFRTHTAWPIAWDEVDEPTFTAHRLEPLKKTQKISPGP
jgi:hypothetical protein